MCRDDGSVIKVLRSVFGYENFRNTVQKKAIMAITEGSKFVCISMPPGFGRLLCYQLPAVLQKGKIAVVFSPKLSRIETQIDFLKRKRINAQVLSPGTYANERNTILKDLSSDSPRIVLLYSTPEMGMTTYFQNLILSLKKRKKLSFIVFDEAHCVSEWGYEYTHYYEKINKFDKVYGYVPRIAVTTTVTNKVIEDICKLLTLSTPKIYKMAAQRINIHHDVHFLDMLDEPFNHLKNFISEILDSMNESIDKIHKGFGIIYCREEATAELIKDKLNDCGIPTLASHYKLSNNARHNVQDKWISGEASVITTTCDYGFIHNKPIKFIIYWTIPESIAKYYRECAQISVGDGLAYSRIYFSVQEYSSVRSIIENHRRMTDPNHIKKRLNEYEKLVSYCLFVNCRHEVISNYFGSVTNPCIFNCDVCKNGRRVQDRTFDFILYSKHTKGVKLNVCAISEDSRTEGTEANDGKQSLEILELKCEEPEALDKEISVGKKNDKQADTGRQSGETFEINWKKPEIRHKGISMGRNDDVMVNNGRQSEEHVEERPKKFEFKFKRIPVRQKGGKGIVQCNYKLVTSNKQKPLSSESSSTGVPLSTRDRGQSNSGRMVKRMKDNTDAIPTSKPAITQPLTDKQNLNTNAISLDPYSSKKSRSKGGIRVIRTRLCRTKISGEVCERGNKSDVVDLTNDDSSEEDSTRRAVVERNRRLKRQFIPIDANPENFKSKRRKTEQQSKSFIDTRINRNRGTDDRVQPVQPTKDDANGSVSRAHATVEYLMNKYNLNRELITLEPRRKS